MRILIDGALCVLPRETRRSRILIDDGRIAHVDAPAGCAYDELIWGGGLVLMPGAIDDQVHFREPGLEYKEDLQSGSRACAKGGVTTFLEMPNTSPATVTQAALEDKLARAARKCSVNFGFYIGATASNVDVLKAARRTPGIKIFIGSSTGDLLVDEQEALERIFAETTLPICAHCEDEATVRANKALLANSTNVADHSQIRSAEAAYKATARAIDLAKRWKHRFHVLHVSTARELELLADPAGLVTAEVCPHHLFFHTGDYARLGTLVQMNPSIKTAADNAGLWQGLLDGRIQVVATDHAPHTLEEKQKPYPQSPSGLPAVENVLPLMLNEVNQGRCTLNQVADWMCDAPARVWDMIGKGRIEEGYDADLVLVDLELKQTIRNEEQWTKSRWSPWDGVTLQGWPVTTIVGGKVVYDRGKLDESVRGSEVLYDHARGGYWGTAGG